jgi:F-type H+-transporting ATPase subunit epsilon
VALQVEVVTPERILFSDEAEMVICRTMGGGEIAFLAGHVPFLGSLEIAAARIKTADGNWQEAAVHGGFVHVSEDKIVLLSDVAELADNIDAERARQAKDRAEQERSKAEDEEDDETESALRRATVRLEVAENA